jgi:hypothetical protein
MGKKSRIIVGLPEGGYMGLCVDDASVFFASEDSAKKNGRKPPFQTELPPGMASEVYDSPDKIPADFCSTTGTVASTTSSAKTTSSATTSAKSAAAKPAAGGGTMKAMDTTCYYINGMIVCDP